ncbi:hypothetical protein DFH27DRAFT_528833 [Peziza echinospora]|nr:hypothetical protein DFH27DRAFT_528833 [Peziza echinospora]
MGAWLAVRLVCLTTAANCCNAQTAKWSPIEAKNARKKRYTTAIGGHGLKWEEVEGTPGLQIPGGRMARVEIAQNFVTGRLLDGELDLEAVEGGSGPDATLNALFAEFCGIPERCGTKSQIKHLYHGLVCIRKCRAPLPASIHPRYLDLDLSDLSALVDFVRVSMCPTQRVRLHLPRLRAQLPYHDALGCAINGPGDSALKPVTWSKLVKPMLRWPVHMWAQLEEQGDNHPLPG